MNRATTWPFSIRIFLPAGEPEGVRIIEKSNWTGVGEVFPRALFPDVKSRVQFSRTGVAPEDLGHSVLHTEPKAWGVNDLKVAPEGSKTNPLAQVSGIKADLLPHRCDLCQHINQHHPKR